MQWKMLRAGRDLALLWFGLALIGLPAARAADGVLEPDCSEAVDNEIRDKLCQGGLVGLAIQPSGAESLLCMPAARGLERGSDRVRPRQHTVSAAA